MYVVAVGARVRVADGEAADRARGVEVGVERRRRRRLHVGDVVEVRALRVERQPVAGVDVERRAGRWMERSYSARFRRWKVRAPGSGFAARGVIDDLLERGRERRERVAARCRPRPAAASCRRASLVIIRSANRWTARGVGDVERLQREIAGFRLLVVAIGAETPHDRGQRLRWRWADARERAAAWS